MIWSMRYKLQTLSIETDMNIMNRKGTTRVKIIEFLEFSPKCIRLFASSPAFTCGGNHESVVKLVLTVKFVSFD